jgi:hypothetical protein
MASIRKDKETIYEKMKYDSFTPIDRQARKGTNGSKKPNNSTALSFKVRCRECTKLIQAKEFDRHLEQHKNATVVCPFCEITQIKDEFMLHLFEKHPELKVSPIEVIDARKVRTIVFKEFSKCTLCSEIVEFKKIKEHFAKKHTKQNSKNILFDYLLVSIME